MTTADRDWRLRFALALVFAVAVIPMGEGNEKFHLLTLLVSIVAFTRPPFGIPAGALLCAMAWAALSLLWSPDRAAGVSSLLWAATLVTVAGATRLAGHEGIRATAWAMEVVAVPTLAYGLGQYLGYFERTGWASPYRLAGPFVNSNLYAAFACVALLLGLARLVAPVRPLAQRLLAAVTVLFAATTLPLTVSRGAWLALLVALAWFARERLRSATARPLAVAVAAVGLGVVAVVGATRLPHASEAIAQRLRGAGNYSVHHRLSIYGATVDLIRTHPFGVGLGGYREAIGAFRWQSDRFDINFAHSEPLELAAVLGIPACFLGAFALSRRLRPAWIAAAHDPALLGAMAAALSLGILSIFDFPLRKPLLAIFVAAIAGGMIGVGATPGGRRRGLFLRLISALIAVVAGTLGVGERLRDQADALREAGSAFVAERKYTQADRWLWPGDPRTARAAGATAARLARAPGFAPVYLPRATAWLDLAHDRSPWRGEVELARAALARAEGDPGAARAHTLRALALNPRDGRVVKEVVGLATDLGDPYTAAIAALQGVSNTPDRFEPRRAVEMARAASLPAETIVAQSDPHGTHAAELDRALRARGESLAAGLLAARSRRRWSPT